MAKSKKKSESVAKDTQGETYAVLARRYRPANFDELIGQEAMVRTLSNAFTSGRIAQAYMLTGVRGVGKTTTARILARALNYERDGVERPTIDIAEPGEHCAAIMESRHVDVLEMDAASHTGIDDIREIIDSARYKPVSARMKVYIIDEVHMLSKAAFNGLLKTLEEPPEHVRFIFATTEVRKVPVTVLSRCQRFDLRRVEVDRLRDHFAMICEKEGVKVDDDALTLIARAAEGSVRDGLSILDQAIAHSSDEVCGEDVRSMLGLADRGRIFSLLETILSGDAGSALEGLRSLYDDGADPLRVLGDLAESVHAVTRIAAVGKDAGDATLSEAERDSAESLADKLDVGSLSRAWQVLLKGLEEAATAPRPLTAAEMVLVRLCYMAELPGPGELARILADGNVAESARPDPRQASPSHTTASAPLTHSSSSPQVAVQDAVQPVVAPDSDSAPMARLETFDDILAFVNEKRDPKLAYALEHHVRPVRVAARSIELSLLDGAPGTLPNDLRMKLSQWTGEKWMVAVTEEAGDETIAERRKARAEAEEQERERRIAEMSAHPKVRELLETFPGARITDVRDLSNDDDAGSD